MKERFFITVRNLMDPTVPEVRIDFTGYKAASTYYRANRGTAEAEGCRLAIESELVWPVPRSGEQFCPQCHGYGSITTRYGGPDGMFPDEDLCPACWGAGVVPNPDLTAAKAS